MFSGPYQAGLLRYFNGAQRQDVPLEDRELWDVTDGRILDDVHELWRELVIFFSFTCDGTEVEKGVSYTPLVIRVLNFPPQVRSLLGNLKLVGFLPPHVTDYQVIGVCLRTFGVRLFILQWYDIVRLTSGVSAGYAPSFCGAGGSLHTWRG